MEWGDKSAAVVTRPLGGLESRAGVERGLASPHTGVGIRDLCGGPEGS